LVNSFQAMLVNLTALTGLYCALNQKRNGYLLFPAVPLFI
jgi:hypothetical protein